MAKLAMVREVKIGLAVISGLSLVLGGVVYKRVTRKPVSPIAEASDSATADPKPEVELASKPQRDLHRAHQLDAGADGSKWLRASASEPTADEPTDSGAPPRPSFMPAARDEAPSGKAEIIADREQPGAQEPAAEPAAPSRDPFAGRREERATPNESPLRPSADPDLSPRPEPAREAPREPQQSSDAVVPSREILAAADEPQAAGAARDDGFRRRDVYDDRAAAAADPHGANDIPDQPRRLPEAPSRFAGNPPAQRDFPPMTGKLPEARPAVGVENGAYTVQPNDNYWVISEKVYGTGGYFKAIHQLNRNKFPHADKLQVGDKLRTPAVAELEQEYPDLCPKRRHVRPVRSATITASARQRVGGKIYVVQEGDTLFDIARYQLGKATRWAEIYDLNRETLGDDFDFLQPGTELTLPGSPQEEDVMTRRRGNTDQR